LVGLVGLATIAYILGKAQGEMIKGAIAVAILGVALIPFAFAMSLIAGLDIGSVLAAAAGLVIFGAAIFALGALMFTGVGALVFGAGLLALAAFLLILPLNTFTKILSVPALSALNKLLTIENTSAAVASTDVVPPGGPCAPGVVIVTVRVVCPVMQTRLVQQLMLCTPVKRKKFLQGSILYAHLN
jgi:hypothetical protein